MKPSLAYQDFTIRVKNCPIDLAPGEIERVVQMFSDLQHAPPMSLAAAFRQSWQLIGAGSPSSAVKMMEAAFGKTLPPHATGPYTSALVKSNHLTKTERGLYKWIGPMTPNTMEGK